MRNRFTLLLVVAILGVGAAAPGASADVYRVAQDDTTAEADDDDGTDYGWIGLLGLAGLAGLAGRKRRDGVVHREPTRGRADVTRDR
jgi:MYXO-CTERM domain-containing protein